MRVYNGPRAWLDDSFMLQRMDAWKEEAALPLWPACPDAVIDPQLCQCRYQHQDDPLCDDCKVRDWDERYSA